MRRHSLVGRELTTGQQYCNTPSRAAESNWKSRQIWSEDTINRNGVRQKKPWSVSHAPANKTIQCLISSMMIKKFLEDKYLIEWIENYTCGGNSGRNGTS